MQPWHQGRILDSCGTSHVALTCLLPLHLPKLPLGSLSPDRWRDPIRRLTPREACFRHARFRYARLRQALRRWAAAEHLAPSALPTAPSQLLLPALAPPREPTEMRQDRPAAARVAACTEQLGRRVEGAANSRVEVDVTCNGESRHEQCKGGGWAESAVWVECMGGAHAWSEGASKCNRRHAVQDQGRRGARGMWEGARGINVRGV